MNTLPTIEKLNQWCEKNRVQIRFHGIAHHSPRLINDGYLACDANCLRLAKEIRSTLKVDEWHALIDTQRSSLSELMHYQVVRYSEMLALRQLGKLPTGLAATVLPFSEAKNTVLLQKRSASSHLFPGCLSLLGGGFNPKIADLNSRKASEGSHSLSAQIDDMDNPVITAQREVFEESGLKLAIPETTLVTVTQETDNGALQINYLAVPADFSGAHADEQEGLLIELKVPSLASVGALESTTDLLKANIAAWLMARSI